MLTSSDAKWRCLWHMMVWSIMLTFVSQFLGFANHIVFYIFASFSMLILPVLTAVYSNTSGRHGAGLLRAGYVFCDPVLSCITVTPVLMINGLPVVISHHGCLMKHSTWNDTCSCIENRSDALPAFCLDDSWDEFARKEALWKTRKDLLIMQLSLMAPILLSLLMGRRTRKMSIPTALLTFTYWFVVAIEATDLIETARYGDIYKHVIFTTEAVISITMIVVNSYAIVTLCSYISPGGDRDKKRYEQHFDLIYKVFVAAAGVFLTEVPLLIARVQVLTCDDVIDLPGTFYVWLLKDMLFLVVIIVAILVDKFCKKFFRLSCKLSLDNTNVFFQPEKRDAYIVRTKQVRFQDPPATMFVESGAGVGLQSNAASNCNKSPVSILQNNSAKIGGAIKKRPVLSLPSGGVRARSESAYDDSSDDDFSVRSKSAHIATDEAQDVSASGEKCNTIQCVKCGKLIDRKSSLTSSVSFASQSSDAETDSCHWEGPDVIGLHSTSLDSGTGTWIEGCESPPRRKTRQNQARFGNDATENVQPLPGIQELKCRTQQNVNVDIIDKNEKAEVAVT